MNRLICSRFDRKIPNVSNINGKTVDLNFKSQRKVEEFYCLATDGEQVYDEKTSDFESFFKKNQGCEKTFLVLTDKEVIQLLRWSQHFNVKVLSFESLFPIFDNIKYYSNLKLRFNSLKHRLEYVRKIGLTSGSIKSTVSRKSESIIRRKCRYKSSYDEVFAHAYIPPYQEVYKLFDFRRDRAIIALDFNSMFADCMSGEFLDPSAVYFEKINATFKGQSWSKEIGLYHVILKRPHSKFFQNYHPFKYTQLGLSLKFKANDTSEVETQLFDFELDYYRKFFDEVHILSALRSKSSMGHPLYNESKRLYRLRTRAEKANKSSLARSYKLQLAMLHSATNRRVEKKIRYKSFSNLLSLLNEELCLTINEEVPYLIKSSPLLKKVKVIDEDKEKSGLTWDLNNSKTIYSFSSQVLARSRLKMFKLLEALLDFEGLDICYVNTDSVHVSIPAVSQNNFFKRYSNLIGSELGKLKIQSIADKAAWLDVGHYYLFKGGDVVQWSNIGLNHKGNNDPFLRFREKYSRVKLDNGVTTTKSKVTFMSSLSYKKRLSKYEIGCSKTIDYLRFSADEINGFDNATLTILKEKQAAKAVKRELFNLLSC
ncbi:hypothetical protein MHM87_01875 [Alteromonas sp. Cnat3-28]|uniref:hypothetical protein n=1 Tax=Alteromonas sp. Cnat3-28 TaxID=2917729 RepID=UPI001EF6E515|nr:hypothetical protein [Alteromonas sp. Cnat3-28]MCG7644330.1 hypothetical protein [Alteromonas sp. Cnat3-28]